MNGETLIAQDITTYLVTQKQPNLAFEELCVGTGRSFQRLTMT